MTPKIGVVIVNWNGLADTEACLASLAAARPGPARVIVVDNGSADGGGSLATLRTGKNLGFAAANNLGVAELWRDESLTHVLLLNNDATVAPDFFSEVAAALADAPDAALLGPTIYVTGTNEVWYAGGYFIPWRALAPHHHVVPRTTHHAPRTSFVTGCALLLSRQAWHSLGPLPEMYFMYLEDAEYSWQAREQGLKIVYAPRAIAYHAVGASVRRAWSSPRQAFWTTRARALFVRRNLRGPQRAAALLYLLVTKPGRALLELLRGQPALAWSIVRGTAQGLTSPHGRRQQCGIHADAQRPRERGARDPEPADQHPRHPDVQRQLDQMELGR